MSDEAQTRQSTVTMVLFDMANILDKRQGSQRKVAKKNP